VRAWAERKSTAENTFPLAPREINNPLLQTPSATASQKLREGCHKKMGPGNRKASADKLHQRRKKRFQKYWQLWTTFADRQNSSGDLNFSKSTQDRKLGGREIGREKYQKSLKKAGGGNDNAWSGKKRSPLRHPRGKAREGDHGPHAWATTKTHRSGKNFPLGKGTRKMNPLRGLVDSCG